MFSIFVTTLQWCCWWYHLIVSHIDDGTYQEFFSGEYAVHCRNCIVQLLFFFFMTLGFLRICVLLLYHPRWWFMHWRFNIIVSCTPVTTVIVFVKKVLNWCLHCIWKFFPPFLYDLFHCKSVIFIHSQTVALCILCLLFILQHYFPRLLPYNLIMVCWVTISGR